MLLQAQKTFSIMHNQINVNEKLNEIGEEEILERLKKYMEIGQIDDDTALIKNTNKDLIINTDLLVEDIHFNETTSNPRNVGWKAVAVNISDLAASGVEEIIGITVGLAVPPSTTWDWVDNIYEGINDALNEYGGKVLGGDCSSSKQKILSITAIGTKGKVNLHRSNARPGDLIVASGSHGLSRLGLYLLLSDPTIETANLSNSLKLKAIESHQKPHAPVIALRKLINCKPKTVPWKAAAIDSSDGLLNAVKCICKSSNCTAILDEDNLPINQEWPNGENWNDLCLQGGEDFELIVSLPPVWAKEWMASMPSCKIIGKMEEGFPEVRWSNGQMVKVSLKNEFKHF